MILKDYTSLKISCFCLFCPIDDEKCSVKGQKTKRKVIGASTYMEDRLKQAGNKQQQGAAVTIHSSLLLPYIL